MAQKNRTREIWLIPKRVNLHQTICLIDGIIERKYDGTSWNPQKQNNLGVNLKKWGATKDGKNISQKLIYFREENSECIDTKGSIENFVENTKKQIESVYDSLFEI